VGVTKRVWVGVVQGGGVGVVESWREGVVKSTGDLTVKISDLVLSFNIILLLISYFEREKYL